jgi:Zn-dependent M28 family amino/carboxypeptidase
MPDTIGGAKTEIPVQRITAVFALALVLQITLSASGVEAQYPSHPPLRDFINTADLSVLDKAISDDSFKGRGPGTAEGEAAADWIADEMEGIGLRPGNHGSYFQRVPAVSITLNATASSLTFGTPRSALRPRFPEDIVYYTPRYATDDVKLVDSPLVFVGYGVVAPEYKWNDYAGVNVKGKTVIILVNDPGNEDAHPDPNFFKGKAMTYYGRWTYKFEEAARQGAAAALIVHETAPAGYAWEVVRNSTSGTRSWLEAPGHNVSMLAIEGWITLETAQDLFKRDGLDYEQLKAAANKRGFMATPMTGVSVTVDAHSTITHATTRNVVGVIRGSLQPGDYVLYTAHWDHLGVKPDVAGADKIYNGAVDNALGVSSILEIANAFLHDKPPPQRSVAFICWTMEEQGLLGSLYFAEHPLWPLNHIVGGINLDANLPEGRAHDLVMVGFGSSQLEDMFAAILKTQGRVLTPDPEPEKGRFYRSDHFSLAKVGVPMLAPAGGYDLIDGGRTVGQALRDDYRIHRYHEPSDEWSPNWDLSGPIEDLKAYYALGGELANTNIWPNWYLSDDSAPFATNRWRISDSVGPERAYKKHCRAG